MSFFSDPTDPKYDTIFSLLKFASAALTFCAGVIGIYSDRTLRNMKPTRLGWTLIALLFLGATSSFWTEWRQERASSAYASKETERLKYLASASDKLLRDTTKIETNADDELSAVKMTVTKVNRLSDNAEETIKRVSKTDDDTLNAVRAARATENRSINLVAQNHRALREIAMVEGQDSKTLYGISKLNEQTNILNSGSAQILQKTDEAVKDVRRGLFPLFRPNALLLYFWEEIDPSTAGAVATRFENMIAGYYADCSRPPEGRVMYDDSEFFFSGGKLISVGAFAKSSAYPSKNEWSKLFSPAELNISIWLKTSANAPLANSDLDMKVRTPIVDTSQPPTLLTYFVDSKRIGMTVGPVQPSFEPANLDIVGMEDLYGSHIVMSLKPYGTDAAPGSTHLGTVSFLEGPERFAFDASNTERFPSETGYQVDAPNDEASFSARFKEHVPSTAALPTCTNQSIPVISSATIP